jgi:hypothetical protein
VSTIDERVQAGIALLDAKLPGWREQVDLDRLDMAEAYCTPADPHSCGCIGALLDDEGDYFRFQRRLFEEMLSDDEPDLSDVAVDYGFMLDDSSEDWDELTAAWKRALTAVGPHEQEVD